MNEQFSIAEKVTVITGAGGVLGGSMPGATLAPDQHFYDMDISCLEKVTSLNMNGTVQSLCNDVASFITVVVLPDD